MSSPQWTRRLFIAAGATLGVAPEIAIGDESMSMRHGIIPATGERLPVVGLGTYIAFDVDSTPQTVPRNKSMDRGPGSWRSTNATFG